MSMGPFKMAVFSDEISQDLNRVMDVVRAYGIDAIELRSVWDINVQDLDEDALQKLKSALDREGIKVSNLASPFFKCHIESHEQVVEHVKMLRKLISMARFLGTDMIRTFTFWREGRLEDYWSRIHRAWQEPKRIAEGEGITLGIENEHSCFIGNGRDLRRFLGELDSPNVKAVWDLANAAMDPWGDKPYPDGYNWVKNDIVHVHLKDARPNPETGQMENCRMGEGVIDFPGQFQALKNAGFKGYLSLETHWRVSHQLDQAAKVLPGGARFSSAGEISSRLCLDSIQEMVGALE